MQSPGHSLAESTTSWSIGSGTGVVAPLSWSSSSSALFTYARPSMSSSKTSGAYCTQMPSPVQRSWSIQTSRSCVSLSPGESCCTVMCPAVPAYPNQLEPALTGVDRFDDTTGGFPVPKGGYSLDVRESARVKIGHAPQSL